MKRILEGLDTWTGRAIVCFLGTALVVMSVFGGVALLVAQHVNVAQECIAKGGTFTDHQENLNNQYGAENPSATESCVLPAVGRP